MLEINQPTSDVEHITVRIAVAAKMLGLGRSKIYELIGSGSIEVVKEGRASLVVVDSLRKYVDDRRTRRPT